MLYVVTGPPAGGKSSWVTAHARAHDIVIDLDRLALSLAGPDAPSWDHHPVLLKVAHRARFAAIDEAVKHRDQVDVYLIHTLPGTRALARYQRWDAQVVTIDPGRDVVMERVKAMRTPGMVAVATRWYRDRSKVGLPAGTRQSSRSW
ncbi:hypothetical protein [Streptomyces sp. UH6]|uniref:hypothetical protein n=1 Tax=Streptomyces sp. UH6 TaxID=2748379 RepID=UPI0015D4EABC|nr:hypothetical protein [Streptomyces sp. UH6]NYV72975.1 hypothetical protein [Streptomyces sp. UH6]